jgi:hypothetical protein
MVRHRGSRLLFTLIALGMAIGSRPTHGQTISFLRPLSGVPLSGGVVVPLSVGAVAAVSRQHHDSTAPDSKPDSGAHQRAQEGRD